MPDLLLLALLLAAVAIGWWLGRRDRKQRSPARQQPALSRDYFVGLNYLLNEQTDQAIETFVAALEVNSDTIETHVALGNLFRSRGEADRAVKVHQNLLARPTLSVTQSHTVQLELSRDFLHLGLLDRAERLLQTLIREASSDSTRHSAKKLLVDLYERERDWQSALDVAQPTLIRQHDDIRRAAAHWLCELAQQNMQSASPSLARKRLRQALSIDDRCVRANWLLAKLEHDTGQYKAEIRYLKRIPEQDNDFTPIILEPLRDAYHLLEDISGLELSLRQVIERGAFTTAIILLAETLQRREGNKAAEDFIRDQLSRTPSLRGIDYLLGLYRYDIDGLERERIELLKRHTRELIEATPRYRCSRCGFSGSHLHWQCPRCRSWGMTKPVTGIEGE
ncbi:lipopolysaccharide assembly protein LapB [Aidingimonas halophila]|uniref:Lipopolysaccharide assembly protein B n=1 Tax=Aidingimonas halophila TaxID=574349 RepID=A0A1H3H9D7_9GAMM|nr:lipopolysaccharide assembly protein LapB [Aidingimonas halophila]GHC36594.1 lipopolysaccharide assembly protein B [Aidingimonas halophila]SDY11394.1 Lipopolysaccharide biosynthesis regulator YciM, contains six TPR domains and a predicted metal-binding C-terminal domain [Aidingimonas halophila]